MPNTISWPPTGMTIPENLDSIGALDLRRVARSFAEAAGLSLTFCASLKKSEAVAFIRNGTLPGGRSTPPEPIEPPASADAITAAITAAIQAAMTATASGGIDREAVGKLVDEKLAEFAAPTTVAIFDPEAGTTRDLGGVHHERFPKLLKMVQARTNGKRLNLYLHGPAGTGKTTAAANVAKALGLQFFFNGAIDSEYKLSGFIDASGTFQSRPFFEAFTKGGVYLFDELDSSMPGAVLAFNAALANGWADFPTGRFDRHPDCVIIAAGNTTLRGDGHASGFQRMEMDAAFRDRFAFLEWPLDEALETACVPAEFRGWLGKVRKVRANVEKHGIKRADVTPRATLGGISLIRAGLSEAEAADSVLRKGLPKDAWEKASKGVAFDA